MKRKFMALTVAITASAIVTTTACDASKKQLEATLVQVQQISAEKDSLLKDVMATSKLIAEVNTELAKVRGRAAGRPVKGEAAELENNLTPAEQRKAIETRIAEITNRLSVSESHLSESRDRVRDLTADNAQLSTQLAAYDSTIADFRKLIDQQKGEIASLTSQVNALQAENTTLKADKATLTARTETLSMEKATLITEKNTVYYVIGTKEELFNKGIIAKRGGLLGLGRTVVPGAAFNPADFTAADRTTVKDIAFPKTDKAYTIISAQDQTALETAPDKARRFTGGLKINDAAKFWTPSKFLILMEQ